MSLSKEEAIAKLKRGIESPVTPDHIKEDMKARLAELEAPEPVFVPPPPKKKVVPIELPHNKYCKENNIDEKSLPLEIRRKIGGLRMLMGKDTEKVRAKGIEVSQKIVELIKAHLTPPPPPEPPPPPQRVLTVEEKARMKQEYDERIRIKREREEEI